VSQSTQFSSLMQSFFAQHLCEHKQVSPRTVTVYRDTFRLLFAFMQTRIGRTPSELGLADLDAPVILEFLEHLETERHKPRPLTKLTIECDSVILSLRLASRR
jgi:integrase/recombinase XerD